MEIMGGLIELDRVDTLPIPWFMRAHLGLETGSKVWFGATDTHPHNRLPDIILSPLDPRKFDDITAVTLSNDEGVGTLADVLDHVRPPVNIALADSVTLEERTHHRINLVLEQAPGSNIDEFKEQRSGFVRRYSPAPDEPKYDLKFSTIYDEQKRLVFPPRRTIVNEGTIYIGDLVERIKHKYSKLAPLYDFTRLVVSSNPDQRLLRYIIPKKGIVTLKLHHEDAPRVLYGIARGIAEANYNILCSRLSRARSTKDERSTFVCECEPSEGSIPPEELISHLELKGAIYGGTIHRGVRSQDSLYPRPPGSINVRPHENYRARISSLREEITSRRPLFLSRRFVELKESVDANVKDTYLQVLQSIRTGAGSAGWTILEAPPHKIDEEIDQAVYPRLWLAEAFLILAFYEDGRGSLSPNQAMELGFARGQNKPAAILIDTMHIPDFNVSNHSGRTFLDYSSANAFHALNENSVQNKVKQWLDAIP
jgi:hypothetical protein